MNEAVRNAMQEALRGHSLCALFIDLQGIEYHAAQRQRDMGRPNGQARLDAFNACARLHRGLSAKKVESIWVVGDTNEANLTTVDGFRESLSTREDREDLDFSIVKPNGDETVLSRFEPNAFSSPELGTHLFRQRRTTALVGGLKVGDEDLQGCVSRTIRGGLSSFALDRIIVVSDATDLTIPPDEYCEHFSPRCLHARTDEILECLTPAGQG